MKPLLRLYQGSINPLSRLHQGSICGSCFCVYCSSVREFGNQAQDGQQIHGVGGVGGVSVWVSGLGLGGRGVVSVLADVRA